ncbi:MAG: hypothetical protein ACE5JR_12830 [Gemmatimonadota bacterium]
MARSSSEDGAWRFLKIAGLAALGVAALGVIGLLVARDQMSRHQRDLFSPHPLRRLAALGYLRSHPAVDNVLLLRDYVAWEERPILRRRAAHILTEMEEDLAAVESAEEA